MDGSRTAHEFGLVEQDSTFADRPVATAAARRERSPHCRGMHGRSSMVLHEDPPDHE